ncbi:uncharacterized protein B0H64DRAFT_29229 [Chaetomium fimeti]|uniref:Uncharacterized protein n=1 Tax=Chaetomium fimeti TaxID=1854472 RepID=A0AAE0HQY6_9PEZI|nr:hypothetical protein B0H64DRAFT_29229 [Chaetomium fimeti]
MDGVGIDHFHHQHQHLNKGPFSSQQLPLHPPRKRKAETAPENNERLSKRLSLLNLGMLRPVQSRGSPSVPLQLRQPVNTASEQSGQKLYVPVENPISQSSQPPTSSTTTTTTAHPKKPHTRNPPTDDSQMQLDNTAHKVYIYNLDDELSSSDNDEDSDHEGRLVFLPDIEKHLRNSRIPSHVLDPRPGAAAAAAAELAGKQLVLYRVPTSLSVPEERDSVRKAIIEARERARERQRVERERRGGVDGQVPVPVLVMTGSSLSSPSSVGGDVPMDAEPLPRLEEDDDPDAMELD